MPVSGPAGARITVTLDNIPLGEALRYVANQAGLKVKVESYAVAVIPLTEQSNDLITKRYHVPPEFFGGPLDVGYYIGRNVAGGGGASQTGTTGISEAPAVATNVIEKEAVSFQPPRESAMVPVPLARRTRCRALPLRARLCRTIASLSAAPMPKQCCKAWVSRFRAAQARLSGRIAAR